MKSLEASPVEEEPDDLMKKIDQVFVLLLFRFMEPAVIVCLGGILPFGSIFIEM